MSRTIIYIVLALVIGVMIGIGITSDKNKVAETKYKELEGKYNAILESYNSLVEWNDGAYGRVTWVQDAAKSDSPQLISDDNRRERPRPKGSEYIICPSKSGDPAKTGICFYDPTARTPS